VSLARGDRLKCAPPAQTRCEEHATQNTLPKARYPEHATQNTLPKTRYPKHATQNTLPRAPRCPPLTPPPPDFAKTCIGTPYYMSPEIFKNKPYSIKADIWAVGCVLYEMCTLNHAFDGKSINQLASHVCKGRFRPISSRYSSHLSDLVNAMLQINPKQRPTMERILQLPFIKRHISEFINSIVDRPSSGIGDGTMLVRRAAINLAENTPSHHSNPPEVQSLMLQVSNRARHTSGSERHASGS